MPFIAPPYTNGIFFYAAGRPEAVPYIRPLSGVARVGGGVPDAPPYTTCTRLGPLLPTHNEKGRPQAAFYFSVPRAYGAR